MDETGTVHRRRRRARRQRVGGAHPRPPRRVHRLGHLPGQPGADRRQHPPGRPRRRRWRGPRGNRAAARARGLRHCGAQARRLLPGAAQVDTRLLLHRHRRTGRGPRRAAPARRRRRHRRRGRHAFLAALAPAGLQACLDAAEQLETGVDTALGQWRREVERARYQAAKAERRYLAVDPDNRLVARGLEADWEKALRTLADAEAELARREAERPRTLTPQERTAILALGADVATVWDAPTTTDRDRKELLRTLLDEVIIHVDRAAKRADLTLRWRGGALTELDRRAAPTSAAEDPHRRGHPRTAPPPGRAPPRRSHRRDPQPARPHQRPRAGVHRLDRVQPAHPLEDPLLPARQPTPTPPGHRRRSGTRAGRRRPPPCTAGSTTGSSPPSRPPPARPGGSGSPTNCAPASSNTPPTATCQCSKPPTPSACPGRRCCSVSSAANSTPSTSAPDAEKAYE